MTHIDKEAVEVESGGEKDRQRSYEGKREKEEEEKEELKGASHDSNEGEKQNQNDQVEEGEEDKEEKKETGSHPWQAVWDSTRQAWYFWNSETQETTWTNPLEASTAGQGGDSEGREGEIQAGNTAEPARATDEEIAKAHGIDSDLAFLDPVLYASEVRQARTGSSTYSASGAFDSRTGKFVPLSARATHDPSRLSHANQADRQMNVFFDVQQYEEERKRSREEAEQEEDAQGNKKRAPTKKELQRYKERAKEKKAARYGWLKE